MEKNTIVGDFDWTALKVLLVDADDQSRAAIRGMLSQLEITQIFESQTGGDALNFIASGFGELDLVIADWAKAKDGVDGLELLDQARFIGSGLPFLIVTEKRDERSVNYARDEGVTYYIGKPYTLKEMTRKLRAIVLQEVPRLKRV